jgi:uncharacterized membrane protein YbhN (UPF0104 family)
MLNRNFLTKIGISFSVVILLLLFMRLDLHIFITTIKNIKFIELLFGILAIIVSIFLRSMRWNIINGSSIKLIGRYWQATSIGYLSNVIYPIRTDGLLRITAIKHFSSNLRISHTISSSIIDALFDVFIVGFAILITINLYGNNIFSIGISSLIFIGLTLVIFYGKYWNLLINNWNIKSYKLQRIRDWLLRYLNGINILQQFKYLISVIILSILAFILDYYYILQIIQAINLNLPYEDIILIIGLFIILGANLSSIGVYQLACILILSSLYGVNESDAIIFSIISQLLFVIIFTIQGVLVVTNCSFKLSQYK